MHAQCAKWSDAFEANGEKIPFNFVLCGVFGSGPKPWKWDFVTNFRNIRTDEMRFKCLLIQLKRNCNSRGFRRIHTFPYIRIVFNESLVSNRFYSELQRSLSRILLDREAEQIIISHACTKPLCKITTVYEIINNWMTSTIFTRLVCVLV